MEHWSDTLDFLVINLDVLFTKLTKYLLSAYQDARNLCDSNSIPTMHMPCHFYFEQILYAKCIFYDILLDGCEVQKQLYKYI